MTDVLGTVSKGARAKASASNPGTQGTGRADSIGSARQTIATYEPNAPQTSGPTGGTQKVYDGTFGGAVQSIFGLVYRAAKAKKEAAQASGGGK